MLASLLALGCDDQQSLTAPAVSTEVSPVVPSFAQGGNGEGAVITRGVLSMGFTAFDEERGLTTLIGNTFAEVGIICAGGEGSLGNISLLEVDRPTGAIKLLLKDKEIPVVVWQVVSGDPCGVLATTTPYAEGTAHLRLVDNDGSPFPVGPGGNSASLHAEGTVTVLGTGEALHYLAIFHNILPRGATSFDDNRLLQAEIKLQ